MEEMEREPIKEIKKAPIPEPKRAHAKFRKKIYCRIATLLTSLLVIVLMPIIVLFVFRLTISLTNLGFYFAEFAGIIGIIFDYWNPLPKSDEYLQTYGNWTKAEPVYKGNLKLCRILLLILVVFGFIYQLGG